MLQEIDQHESPLLWVLVHENYFADTLVRSFQADFHRRFQAPSFSTVSAKRSRWMAANCMAAILCDLNRLRSHPKAAIQMLHSRGLLSADTVETLGSTPKAFE